MANKHYLQVTDEHFASAIASPTNQNDAESDALTAHSGEKAAQNPAQHPAAPTGTAPQNPSTSREKRPLMRKAATTCEVVQLSEVPPRGAELSDDSSGNRPVSKAGGAECGPLEVEIPLDVELVELILSWHELPEETKILVSRHFHDL